MERVPDTEANAERTTWAGDAVVLDLGVVGRTERRVGGDGRVEEGADFLPQAGELALGRVEWQLRRLGVLGEELIGAAAAVGKALLPS